jgi:hypothetical protein
MEAAMAGFSFGLAAFEDVLETSVAFIDTMNVD